MQLVLIEPLWNWNCGRRLTTTTSNKVLIEPLWNWNRFCKYFCPFCSLVLIEPLWNWNSLREKNYNSIVSINRTFMELKQVNGYLRGHHKVVLIEPLWNWNYLIFAFCRYIISINRTFMELKPPTCDDVSTATYGY